MGAKNHPKTAKVKRDDLARAIGKASGSKGHTPSAHLQFSASELAVTCSSGENSPQTAMSIPAQFTGEPVEVALNGKYLKDFLDVVPENDLEFQLNDPQSVILLAAAAQPRAFQYVCMPLNT